MYENYEVGIRINSLPDTGLGIPQEAALQPANHQACQNTPSETKGCIRYQCNACRDARDANRRL
jgi:hypothetical protein